MHSPIAASTYQPDRPPVGTYFHHNIQPNHLHQQQQPQFPQATTSVHVQHHFSVANHKTNKDQTLPMTGNQYQSFESPASKLNQLHQSSVQLDMRVPSEFNTYHSVEMKRDFHKGIHTDSQDALGSEGKIVIHSRSPSISQKGQLVDTMYMTQHQQSRESTISRVASVQEDPNNMRRSSGNVNTVNNNSARFDRFSQGQPGHKELGASMAQSMNVSSRGHNIISNYNTAGSSYGNLRMHEDPKNQALLVKIQELRDTNEMKDSQILLLHRENAILKDNIELLKRKVHVVSTDLKQKTIVLKQKDKEICHLTDNLTHLTNKQFAMTEAYTQTEILAVEGLSPPDERNCRQFTDSSLFVLKNCDGERQNHCVSNESLVFPDSFNNINPFPCSASGSEYKIPLQQVLGGEDCPKGIAASSMVPDGFVLLKATILEELQDKKHTYESQVSKLAQEVEFLNHYIHNELTSYTQGIAHLKEDIKIMKSQNSKGSTFPGTQMSRTQHSVQSWEEMSLHGSKQGSVSTNLIIQEKSAKPVELELEAVRISMEKMKQSFSLEKEQLLVENIKLKRRMHELKQGSLKMRSLAGEPTAKQQVQHQIANNGAPRQSPRKGSGSLQQRDSLGSIDIVPIDFPTSQPLHVPRPSGLREPFTKQHTHGGEMNSPTKTGQQQAVPSVVPQVDRRIDVPPLALDQVAALKHGDMPDHDSLYQSQRLSADLPSADPSSEEEDEEDDGETQQADRDGQAVRARQNPASNNSQTLNFD